MEEFFQIGLWYSKRRIVNGVTRIYERALRACYEMGRLEFRHGRTTLRQSVRRIRRLLSEERPRWRYQTRRLDLLLTI